MDKFVITGGSRLQGEISVNGGKNAVLPILAACLLSDGVCVLHNVPILNDVFVMCNLLKKFGVKVVRQQHTVVVDSTLASFVSLDETECAEIRASSLFLGASLARFNEVILPYPGGCNIGSRPLDYHLQAIVKLGAEVVEAGGYIEAVTQRLQANDICFDFPSVGATENAIMVAAKAYGTTLIRNCAREPEIIDLCNFINSMGGKISGAGTDTITVCGVEHLGSTEYCIMPDRIEVGTLMCATAITHGDVIIKNAIPSHEQALIAKLKEAGVKITQGNTGIRVRSSGRLHSVDVKTLPYPGFPTDMQAQFMALMSLAQGTSIITENIFEDRFRQAPAFLKMGADIKLVGRGAVVSGATHLSGANVAATDLRGGAALICAALAAVGTTIVENAHFIDRGYENIETSLTSLGANIIRLRDSSMLYNLPEQAEILKIY